MTNDLPHLENTLLENVWTVPFPRSRLTYPQYLTVMYGFAVDETAAETARQCGLSPRSVTRHYAMLRLFLFRLADMAHRDWNPAWDNRYEDFHDARSKRHPGWRHEDAQFHQEESRVRLYLILTGRRFELLTLMFEVLGRSMRDPA